MDKKTVSLGVDLASDSPLDLLKRVLAVADLVGKVEQPAAQTYATLLESDEKTRK